MMLGYTGLIWAVAGVVIASPLLALPFYPEEWRLAWTFALPGVALGVLGGAAYRRFRPSTTPPMKVSIAMAVVVAGWLGALVAGALPFMLALELDFTQAMFESTSGWTTTGLSVVNVSAAPKTILLLRSNLELAGGAGLAILMIAFMGGPLGPGLAAAEGRPDQILPHVTASTKLVIRMYAAYALVGTLALWAAGMDPFSAVNHAFCAISTGGFSTEPDSIGHWDSVAVEVVTMVLMLLGTTNFAVAHTLMRGNVREYLRNGEVRTLWALVAIAFPILLLVVGLPLYGSVSKATRVVFFETISALSTTGYSTVSYGAWQRTGWLVLIGLMIVGGGAGSTAGGMKQARIYTLLRVAVWHARTAMLPRGAAERPRYGSGEQWQFFADDVLIRTAGFAFVYMCTVAAGTLVMTIHGYPIEDALFEMASTVGTVGLSVGITAADAPPVVLWTQTACMFLGRLEFFALLVGARTILSEGRHFFAGDTGGRRR